MEPVEAAPIGNELGTLFLEHLPDRSVGLFGMGMRLGPGDAFVHEPGVQLVVALEPQPRREEAPTHEPDLVLDLTLLPARRRRASDRLDKMVRAHLQEAAIVLTILTDEDRLHRGLHVVINSATTGAFEECERPFVGDAHEHHPAVAEAQMRDLHDRRHPVHHNDLVAPVELIGLARRERQRHKGICRRARIRLCPASRITADGVIAAVVSERPQLLENPDQGQSLSRRRFDVRRQQPIELLLPSSEFRARLHLTLIRKRRLVRSQDLTNRVAGQPQVACDLLDRLAVNEVLTPYPTDRLHNQHPPPPASCQSRQTNKSKIGGSILDADPLPQGVTFPRRITLVSVDHAGNGPKTGKFTAFPSPARL